METNDTRRKLPDPRWLPMVAAFLALWACVLGVWWTRLHPAPAVAAQAQPKPSPTRVVARATVPPTEPAQPTPAGTPRVSAVVRTPGQLVLREDWDALARAFDVDRAMGYIAELIKPEFAGRAAGSPGGWLAGEWIAERFAEYGLQPAGDGGTYFQEFPVPYTDLTAMPTLDLLDEAGQVLKEYRFRYDYTIWPGGEYTDGGQAEGPVFWLSDGEHDDYDDVDVQGGVVLCRYRRPFEELQRQALEHGAEALLMVTPAGADFRMRRTARSDGLLPEGIPTLIISEEVTRDLLKKSGLTLEDLTIQFKAVVLGTRLRVNVPLTYQQGVAGRNVLGVIPGSDPDGVDQVFVIGAHYDHMGADPDGTVWHGANDDASGVAVMLEMARVWQEQGYVPKRTVLFGAWDGEEIGLNGSRYYVEHPRYPLVDTIGMLQLDMVGAGTTRLVIDPGGVVADQSMYSAQHLDIEVAVEEGGGSDHAPFDQARVPATVYIWWAGHEEGLVYHVPEDDLSNIEPDRLEQAGVLAHLVTLNMSWEHEELEDLIATYPQAVFGQDRLEFLALLDPGDEELRQAQEDWLDSLVLHPTSEFTATVGQALVSGDVATSTISLRYRWDAGEALSSASFPARWVRRGLDWYYDGPAWDQVQTDHVVVKHLQQPWLAERMAEEAGQWYAFLSEEAGWSLPQTVRIQFYGVGGATDDAAFSVSGSRNLLHALHSAPDGYESAAGWAIDGGIVLSDNAYLETTLTEYALQNAGWSATTASWLGHGLVRHRTISDTAAAEQLRNEYLSMLLQADREARLWRAVEMPTLWQTEVGERGLWEAEAWALTDHVLATEGWAVLQNPATLMTDTWRTAMLDPWLSAAQGIEQTLTQRAQAVLAQDRAMFLSTVDPLNKVLYVEETRWFDDLASYPVTDLTYASELLELDGNEAIIDLRVNYRAPTVGWPSLNPNYRARFVYRNGRWLYSDLDFYEQHSEHFVLRYEHEAYGDYATQLLAESERAYEQVTSDLVASPETPIEIKLYHQSDVFRFSIYVSMHRITGWNEPGEAVKLNVSGRESFLEQGAVRVIAHELTHAVLFARGVQHGAIHEGIAEYEAIRFDPITGNPKVREYRRKVYDLVRSKRSITIEDLAVWREVAADDVQLFYSVGWDFVTYFRERFGREVLLEWLGLLSTDMSFQEAFVTATGVSFADFDADWRDSVLRGHIDVGFIETAQAFDGDRALQEVRVLAQDEWMGRETGTLGNQAAAQYIADQFAAYGLEPAGDSGTYFQVFDVERTSLAAAPTLQIRGPQGEEHSLQYRVEFHEVLGGHGGAGRAEGTIVFVRNPGNGDANLGGRVMLTFGSGDPLRDAEYAAQHDAGGLLLVTDKWFKHMQVKPGNIPPLLSQTIPVYELTREASEALFKQAGYMSYQWDMLPDVLPLELSARMAVRLVEGSRTEAANVLGVIRGNDPAVADEVLIVGAHLDHVGSLPDGTIFPGANNDASGVAVLLEIARLWHDTGYRPRRTVLFAAWNAAEMGSLGSETYVTRPAYPLRETLALIELDQVGGGAGYYIIVSGNETQEALVFAHLENAAKQVEGRLTFEKYTGGSDHDPFHRRGVPAVLLSWEEPVNSYTPDDTPGSLDALKLAATGRVAALTLMTLAEE